MHVSTDSMWRRIWKILQNFLGTKPALKTKAAFLPAKHRAESAGPFCKTCQVVPKFYSLRAPRSSPARGFSGFPLPIAFGRSLALTSHKSHSSRRCCTVRHRSVNAGPNANPREGAHQKHLNKIVSRLGCPSLNSEAHLSFSTKPMEEAMGEHTQYSKS
jgi:hypothetical protein